MTTKETRIRQNLMKELKCIYDNKDFVCGTISIAGSADIWQELLNCISIYREEDEEISPDDILALALVLKREEGERKPRTPKRNKVAAAIL